MIYKRKNKPVTFSFYHGQSGINLKYGNRTIAMFKTEEEARIAWPRRIELARQDAERRKSEEN